MANVALQRRHCFFANHLAYLSIRKKKMKKTWLLALLVGFSALSVSCSDDAGDESNRGEQDQNQGNATYALTCVNPDCKMSLEQGKTGIVIMKLAMTVGTDAPVAVSGANISVAKTDSLVKLQAQDSTSVELVSDTSGMVTLLVTADAEKEGVEALTFASKNDGISFEPVKFEVTVVKATVAEPDNPNPGGDKPGEDGKKTTIDVDYKGKLTYAGEIEAFSNGEVFLLEGKTCAQVAPSGMSATEIGNIKASELSAKADSNVLTHEYGIKVTEIEEDIKTYAAVARVKTNDVFAAYGCTDGVMRDNVEFTVALEDAFNDVTPDPDPETTVRYDGNYRLRSQFNALTLLPHAAKVDGKPVLFKDMLAGDWIEFALNFLSNPEKEITSIISDQLVPLLLQGDWLKKLLTQLGLGGVADTITPELLQSLIKTFGINTIIENLLKELTGQLPWWGTATDAVEMVKDLATNFTLDGEFVINTPALDEKGMIAGIGHSYDALLYNNAAFDKCYVGSDSNEKTADGKTICRIPLSSLDTNSSVRGTFTASFPAADGALPTKSDIAPHTLQLAYGKLIYATLLQTIPMFIKPEDGAEVPKTLGRVLEYYIGYGLKTLWNKDEAHKDNLVTKSYCGGISEYAMKLLEEKAQSVQKVIAGLGGEVLLAGLCDQGVKALDKLINTQLDKLTVSNEKVSFTSNDCIITYTPSQSTPTVSALTSFGQKQVWGATTDNRCKWSVSVAEGKTVEGKFWAERK